LPNTLVLASGAKGMTIRERLLNEASAKRSNNLLVVVGHNEEGVLKLPDHSSLELDELSVASDRSGRPLLVLSCETLNTNVVTAGFVTTRALYFDEITSALASVLSVRKGRQTFGTFVRDVNVAMAGSQSTGGSRRVVLVIAFVGGSLAIAAVL